MKLSLLFTRLDEKIHDIWSGTACSCFFAIHCTYGRGGEMPSTLRVRKSKRLNFRISDAQEELLRRGATAKRQSVTEFIVESACAVAQCELSVQTEFKLPPQLWKDFLAALDKPATPNPALHRLLTEPGVLERD